MSGDNGAKNGNHERIIADAKQRLTGVEFEDAQGNRYRPLPNAVEVTTRHRYGPLSATERETERLAMRDQIVALTKELAGILRQIDRMAAQYERQQKAIDGLATFDREQDRRIDAIERGAAILSAWIKRPFWERVRARLGL